MSLNKDGNLGECYVSLSQTIKKRMNEKECADLAHTSISTAKVYG